MIDLHYWPASFGLRSGISMLALALTFGLSCPVKAQAAVVPPVYFTCNFNADFFLPTASGKPPTYFDATRPRKPTWTWPEGVGGPEVISGEAIVGEDGQIIRLSMTWSQMGRLAWPYRSRADLDEVFLDIRFGDRYWKPSVLREPETLLPSKFDPQLLTVSIDARQLKKIKHPLLLHLQRPYEPYSRLGGLTHIPGPRKSASIYMTWPELATFAGSHKLLEFEIAEIVLRGGQFHHDRVRSGRIDLTGMPKLIDQFRAVEAGLHMKAADRQQKCTRKVQGVSWVEDEGDIATTGSVRR
jgi:hypothetical protein